MKSILTIDIYIMNQLNKFHKKRIEYRTVNLVYSSKEGDVDIDLFNLNTIYAGEDTGNTFLTRQFDLNLADKNPIKVRIFNISYQTPTFFESLEGDLDDKNFYQTNGDTETIAQTSFNQTILLESELFGPYGQIPITLKTDKSFLQYIDVTDRRKYNYGIETLNNVDFTYTPTKQLLSLNPIKIRAVNTYFNFATIGNPFFKNRLLLVSETPALNTYQLQKHFTISFIVELTYDN